MKTLSFLEKFADVVFDVVGVMLTGYEGRTESGDHIITYSEINAKNEPVTEGRALFFRNNNLGDILVDENGVLQDPWVLSRDGKWITQRGSGVDTEGFGRNPK
jgi:hypothetical protein